MKSVCLQSNSRTPLPDIAGAVDKVPQGAKHNDVYSSWWSFNLRLLSLFACCGGLNIYYKVHSQALFTDQIAALFFDQKRQPKQMKSPNQSSLVNTWSLVARESCLLFVYIDLTWNSYWTASGKSPITWLTLVPFLFHRCSTPICFLACRNSEKGLLVTTMGSRGQISKYLWSLSPQI